MLAGLIFLGPSMAYFFARLHNMGGLKRLASLLLHRDETAGEAIAPLNAAIRLAPGDASLFDRRALAHALAGSEAAAERDWARAAELDPGSIAPTISRGWLALRRDRASEAAAHFEVAGRASPKERWAWIGLAVAKLKLGEPAQAIAALEQVPPSRLQALDLTYLAEALLALGDAKLAERTASDAIDELDFDSWTIMDRPCRSPAVAWRHRWRRKGLQHGLERQRRAGARAACPRRTAGNRAAGRGR